MARSDIRIEISFDIVELENSEIKTNAKKEKIRDILENWARCQIGKGEDKRQAKEEFVYQIVINLDLSDDTFYTTSNTGNKGLTAGIVMEVIKRLDEIKIVDL